MEWLGPIMIGVFAFTFFYTCGGTSAKILAEHEGPRRLSVLLSWCGLCLWATGAAMLAYFTYGTQLLAGWFFFVRTTVLVLLPAFFFVPRFVLAIYCWIHPTGKYLWPSIAAISLAFLLIAYIAASRIHRDVHGEWYWGSEGRYQFRTEANGTRLLRLDTATGEIRLYSIQGGRIQYRGVAPGPPQRRNW